MRVSGKTVVLGSGVYLGAVAAALYYVWRSPRAPPPCCARELDEAARLEAFARGAKGYDGAIGCDETFMGLGLLRRHLVGQAQGRVLEVAAGTGRNLSYYDPGRVKELVQTDPCEEMLVVAREKLRETTVLLMEAQDARHGAVVGVGLDASMAARAKGSRQVLTTPRKVRVELRAADAHALPFPDASFDTVVDTFGLCSMEHPVRAVEEMQRVCKPGGRILLLEHGRSPYGWLSRIQDRDAEKHAQRWGCYWNKDIGGLLREAGLAVQSRWDWHFGTTNVVVGISQRRREEEVQQAP